MYLNQEYPTKKVNLKFCVAYDLFGDKVHYTPKSFKLRKKHIQDACEEIKIKWPHL